MAYLSVRLYSIFATCPTQLLPYGRAWLRQGDMPYDRMYKNASQELGYNL